MGILDQLYNPQEGLYDEFGRAFRVGHMPEPAVSPSSLEPYHEQLGGVDVNLPLPQRQVMIPPNVQNMPEEGFPTAPFEPRPISEYEKARLALTPPNYNDPQFKQSRGRTVLNAIVGGLAGVGHPELGVQVGRAMHDAPYNKAMHEYQTQTADLDKKIAEENERYKQGMELQKMGTSREAALALAGYRTGQLGVAQGKLGIQTADEKRKQDLAQAEINFKNWRMANPTGDITRYVLGLSEADRPAALDVIKQIYAAKRPTGEEIKTNAKLRTEGKYEAQGEPNVQSIIARTARTTAENKKIGELSTGDYMTPDQQSAVGDAVRRATYNFDAYQQIMDEFPKGSRERYAYQKAVTQTLIARGENPAQLGYKLTPDQQKIFTASKAAGLQLDGIEKLMKEAEQKNLLGPLAGRLAKTKQMVGGDWKDVLHDTGISKWKPGTPERIAEDRLVGELTGLLGYLSMFEASTVSGSRPSKQLIDAVKLLSPDLRMNPALFEGAIKAARDTINARLGGITNPSKLGMPYKPASITPNGLKVEVEGR